MKGRLITFEGIEGSGKSTQIRRLAEALERRGRKVIVTREPGGTRLGEAIRRVLLDARQTGMDPRAELLLYLASRIQHVSEVIRPAIDEGRVVLCDRFSDATLAYQGFGRGLGAKEIAPWVDFSSQGVRPDRTLLLDLDVPTALNRIKARTRLDRFDSETEAFFTRVREGYLYLARQEPDRFRILDSSRPVGELAAEILRTVVEPEASNRVVPEASNKEDLPGRAEGEQ